MDEKNSQTINDIQQLQNIEKELFSELNEGVSSSSSIDVNPL